MCEDTNLFLTAILVVNRVICKFSPGLDIARIEAFFSLVADSNHTLSDVDPHHVFTFLISTDDHPIKLHNDENVVLIWWTRSMMDNIATINNPTKRYARSHFDATSTNNSNPTPQSNCMITWSHNNTMCWVVDLCLIFDEWPTPHNHWNGLSCRIRGHVDPKLAKLACFFFEFFFFL